MEDEMRYFTPIIPYLVPVLWGLSGYLGGLFSPKAQSLFSGFFWISLGFALLSGALVLVTNFQDIFSWRWDAVGFWWGLVYAMGALVFALAIYVSGSATKVVAISALYPVVTALLFFFMHHESLTLRKTAGIILAVVVGWLMA